MSALQLDHGERSGILVGRQQSRGRGHGGKLIGNHCRRGQARLRKKSLSGDRA